VVAQDFELHRKIMDEAHCSRYSIHSGTNKIYQDLKKNFWWTSILNKFKLNSITI
jgi:hypothetical protein